MKKIMFLHCTNEYSGAENISLNIANNLAKRGYDVVYCSPIGTIKQYINKWFPNIRYFSLKRFNYFEVKKALRKENPDIVHAADFRVSMLMSVENYPYVAHLHNNPHWIRKKSIFTLALLRTLNKSVGNIYVSQSIEDEFVFSKYVKNRTQIIENVVSADRVINSIQQKLPEHYDIGFFGRLTEQKNPIRFLKILKEITNELPNTSAIMVGKSDETLDDEIKDFLKVNPVNIKLVGFQENPYKYMNNCRIVIMPSKWEGFGLTAVEAMLLGKPVLSTDAGGLKDVQRDTGNICHSDKEFVQKAIQLLQNESVYFENSKLVKTSVKRFTDVDKYVDKVISIYDSEK